MFSNLTNYLNSNDIQYAAVKKQTAVAFSMKAENGIFQCFAEVKEELNIFIFYSTFGFVIPENRRVFFCELLTRINCGLVMGNFELDMNEGELRYKTSIDYEGGDLIDKFIENIISSNLSVIDSYCDVILHSINSELSAKDLLQKYEETDEPQS